MLLSRLRGTLIVGVFASTVPACMPSEEPSTDPESKPASEQEPEKAGSIVTGKVLMGGGVVEATYRINDEGYAVTNGDILVTPLADDGENIKAPADKSGAEATATTSQALATRTGFLWPVVSGYVTVPYVLNSSLTPAATKSATIAMSRWSAAMNVKFVTRSTQADYISFDPATGCGSYVGKNGGKQPILLAAGCASSGAVHEIGHALGAFHEHTRTDRDSFVVLEPANIQPGLLYNFDKYSLTSTGQDNGLYDFRSIMHYDSTAFSIDTVAPQRTTIRQKANGKSISRSVALSSNDICWMKKRYFPAATCSGSSTCTASVTGNETKATALDIGSSRGATATRRLCRADVAKHDVDWFKFEVSKGNIISINGEIDTAAIALIEGTTLIASALVADWTLPEPAFTYTATKTGTMYIEVSGGDQTYKLKVGW